MVDMPGKDNPLNTQSIVDANAKMRGKKCGKKITIFIQVIDSGELSKVARQFGINTLRF